MFKCNLTGAAYTFESMNLLDLRNKIIEQYGLSPWDIYAGYSEKSVMSFVSEPIIESDITTPWKIKLAQNIKKRIEERKMRTMLSTIGWLKLLYGY